MNLDELLVTCTRANGKRLSQKWKMNKAIFNILDFERKSKKSAAHKIYPSLPPDKSRFFTGRTFETLHHRGMESIFTTNLALLWARTNASWDVLQKNSALIQFYPNFKTLFDQLSLYFTPFFVVSFVNVKCYFESKEM